MLDRTFMRKHVFFPCNKEVPDDSCMARNFNSHLKYSTTHQFSLKRLQWLYSLGYASHENHLKNVKSDFLLPKAADFV